MSEARSIKPNTHAREIDDMKEERGKEREKDHENERERKRWIDREMI